VRIVDIAGPNVPAETRKVAITGGVPLRDVHCTLDTLSEHDGQYGEAYLRVYVELEGIDPSLPERVRQALPNALQIIPVRTDTPANASDAPRQGLEPYELIARYYRESHGQEIPKALMTLFNELYEEALHASS
jgi:hypothetical protein